MKSLLCAIAKNEDRYIEEWVNHHLSIGFDKIIIYDNNDIDGEAIDLSNNRVQVIDYRGKHVIFTDCKSDGIQEESYNDCYINHSDGYNWIAYLDIDEFLFIDNGLNVNEFLSQSIFNNVDAIQINWEIYSDNGKICYENKPVLDRFTTPTVKQYSIFKTIVKTNLPNMAKMHCHNAEIKNGVICHANGNIVNEKSEKKINYDGARIKHFYTKTIDEFIDRKIGKTSATGRDYMNDVNFRMHDFFTFNEKTDDKIRFAIDKLHGKGIQWLPL